jgi:hypothetical protein
MNPTLKASAKNDVANFIADFRAQIAELQAVKDENPNGWVVKVGSLWIHFNGPAYSLPAATGSLGASVIRTQAEAYRVAKFLKNGVGDAGKVQSRIEALAENIAALEGVIAFLESGKYV